MESDLISVPVKVQTLRMVEDATALALRDANSESFQCDAVLRKRNAENVLF
jgi:hypothetical protein